MSFLLSIGSLFSESPSWTELRQAWTVCSSLPLAHFILDSLETWAFKFSAVGHMLFAFLQLFKFGLGTLQIFPILLST